jgi:hypothetical protein
VVGRLIPSPRDRTVAARKEIAFDVNMRTETRAQGLFDHDGEELGLAATGHAYHHRVSREVVGRYV